MATLFCHAVVVKLHRCSRAWRAWGRTQDPAGTVATAARLVEYVAVGLGGTLIKGPSICSFTCHIVLLVELAAVAIVATVAGQVNHVRKD